MIFELIPTNTEIADELVTTTATRLAAIQRQYSATSSSTSAVTHHPQLRQARAKLGEARALNNALGMNGDIVSQLRNDCLPVLQGDHSTKVLEIQRIATVIQSTLLEMRGQAQQLGVLLVELEEVVIQHTPGQKSITPVARTPVSGGAEPPSLSLRQERPASGSSSPTVLFSCYIPQRQDSADRRNAEDNLSVAGQEASLQESSQKALPLRESLRAC